MQLERVAKCSFGRTTRSIMMEESIACLIMPSGSASIGVHGGCIDNRGLSCNAWGACKQERAHLQRLESIRTCGIVEEQVLQPSRGNECTCVSFQV